MFMVTVESSSNKTTKAREYSRLLPQPCDAQIYPTDSEAHLVHAELDQAHHHHVRPTNHIYTTTIDKTEYEHKLLLQTKQTKRQCGKQCIVNHKENQFGPCTISMRIKPNQRETHTNAGILRQVMTTNNIRKLSSILKRPATQCAGVVQYRRMISPLASCADKIPKQSTVTSLR